MRQVVTDFHAIEGVQENDVCLVAIIDEGLGQLSTSYVVVYYHCIGVWGIPEVHILCIKCERYMRPLGLDNGPRNDNMFNPSVEFFVFWCLFSKSML